MTIRSAPLSLYLSYGHSAVTLLRPTCESEGVCEDDSVRLRFNNIIMVRQSRSSVTILYYYYTDHTVCSVYVFFLESAAAAADCIVRRPVVLDFCARSCVCVYGSASINYYCLFCWSLFIFFFSRYLLLFFRLVLSAGQLKRVLNEPIRIILLLLPVYYCNYGGGAVGLGQTNRVVSVRY